MRKSNVNLARLPKFYSHDEAVAYFARFGTLEYFGRDGPELYCIYVFMRNDGRRYFIDICDDGTVAVIRG